LAQPLSGCGRHEKGGELSTLAWGARVFNLPGRRELGGSVLRRGNGFRKPESAILGKALVAKLFRYYLSFSRQRIYLTTSITEVVTQSNPEAALVSAAVFQVTRL
jgi:hypothetical protein